MVDIATLERNARRAQMTHRRPSVTVSPTPGPNAEQLAQGYLRGVANWVPNAVGAQGDIIDLAMAGNKAALQALRGKPVKYEPTVGPALRNNPVMNTVRGGLERLLNVSSGKPEDANVGEIAADILNPAFVPAEAARVVAPVARGAGRLIAEGVQRAVMEGRGPLARMLAPSAPLNIVKEPGGNWLSGSVEDALSGLKKPQELRLLGRQMDAMDELAGNADLIRNGYLNQYIEGPLTKYVRNEMATAKDPIRLQIEAFQAQKEGNVAKIRDQIARATQKRDTEAAARGVPTEYLTQANARINELNRNLAMEEARTGLHFDPQDYDIMRKQALAEAIRRQSNFPEAGISKNPTAKGWEVLSDAVINPLEARDLSSAERAASFGGRSDVPPDTLVHSIDQWRPSNLGFSHLIDEVNNALNPASGLPKELLLDPKNLQKLTPAQLSAHVDKINAWRAVQQAEANRALAAQAPVIREYPHSEAMPNPRGLRWQELKAGDLPEGWRTAPKNSFSGEEQFEHVGDPGVFTRTDPRRQALADQLKYEGDMMKHCVGGYCPDVLEGRSRIFSLRDDKGKPHVTIEVSPPPPRLHGGEEDSVMAGAWDEALKKFGPDEEGTEKFMKFVEDRVTVARQSEPWAIKQIKSFSNKAPDAEYLPFVQDFVRNPHTGQPWADVGDLGNAGLVRHPKTNELMTQQEYDTLFDEAGMFKPEVGFAHGGPVTQKDAHWSEYL